MPKKPNKNEKLKFALVIVVIFAFIFAFLLILSLGVYRYDWDGRFMRAAESIVPFPAVYVKGAGIVTVKEIKDDSEAVKKFYESQNFDQIGMRIDFSTEQGKNRLKIKEKDIVNKLIENKIIENLAKKRDINISDSIVDSEVESNINQYGNKQNLMSELGRLYGWALQDFKKKVVKPELYSEKLSDAYSSEVDNSEKVKKINSLYERVAVKKEDFSKVAEDSSEGQSSENGGDLGWSTKDQLISEIGEKAFSMTPGQISQVIETDLGYHVVKLDEIKDDNGEKLAKIRQIFVKKTTFSDWLNEKMKNYPVTVFLKGYKWNSDESQVDFVSQDLINFEKNTDINSAGDPSIF